MHHQQAHRPAFHGAPKMNGQFRSGTSSMNGNGVHAQSQKPNFGGAGTATHSQHPARFQQQQHHQHQQRPATAPSNGPTVVYANGKGPDAQSQKTQTGRTVNFLGGSDDRDVDDLLTGGTSVLPRTIAFRKSASAFSSTSTTPLTKTQAPQSNGTPNKPQQLNGKPHQQQQNCTPNKQQQPNGATPKKPQMQPNGMHKQANNTNQQQHKPPAHPNGKHANQRSPALKPLNGNGTHGSHLTEGRSVAMRDGVPVVLEKDPSGNTFRWPKRYLYPSAQIQSLLPWTSFEKIGCGLHNLGNTCFANAVLQALAYTPPLANFLRRSEHSKMCRLRANPDQFCLFCALESTVQSMHAHKQSAMAPRAVISHLRSISRSFRLGRQEDSHEFLRFVMDMLQANDLAAYGGSKRVTDLRVQETTTMFGIFGGYFRSQVRCCECNYRSNTYDAFLDLSLEVSDASSVTRALQSFTRPEKLDADNMYRCARCAKKVRAEKQLSIFKAPTVLCVHLKRFQFAHAFGGKINKPIKYEERLGLGPYMADRASNPTYALYAVLVHAGSSIHSGHYYSYVKSSAGLWHCMDDSSVRQVSLAHVLEQRAYILFYVRADAIETLPMAAPSPGVSPSLGPMKDPAAQQKKVAALNLELAAKKLAQGAASSAQAKQPEQPAAAPKSKNKNTGAASDEENDDDDDDDDDSYSEGDSDEEMEDVESDESSESAEFDDDYDDQEKFQQPLSGDELEDDEEDTDDDESEVDAMMYDNDDADEHLAAQPSRNIRWASRPIRIATNMQFLGLLPRTGAAPRYFVPADPRARPQREHSAQPAMSRKRARLLAEMQAEVADLSDEEIQEDEEITSDEEDLPAAPSKSKQMAAKSRPDDNADPKRRKTDATATKASTPAPAAAANPTPKPFFFSAAAEALASGWSLSTAPPKPEASASLAAAASPALTPATPAAAAPAPKPANTFSTASSTPVTPATTPAAKKSTGPIIVGREAFDPRLLQRQFAETTFGQTVGDWDQTVSSQEATSAKYAMKRAHDLTNARVAQAQARSVKTKDAWDEELDRGHVRKVRNRDILTSAGQTPEGGNLFQAAQNQKNRARDAARTGQPLEEPNSNGDRSKKKRGASRGLAAKGHMSHRERNLARKKKGGPRTVRDVDF